MIRALRAELRRTNFSGRDVTLAEGGLVVLGATALAARTRRASDVALLAGIGALGLVDDLWEPHQRRAGTPVSKGLRGHLGALRRGRLTTGAAKALGIPLLALAAAAAAPRPRGGAMVVADAALIAGCANLANLLDLRPGRALKAVLPAAVLLASAPAAPTPGPSPSWTSPGGTVLAGAVPAGASPSGAAARGDSGRRLALAAAVPAALALPVDLREHGMLGDAGANVLGAAVGTAVSRRLPVGARLSVLAVVVALTLASERVSFSAVIDDTPALRALDRLGRRRDPAAEER